MLNSNTLRKQTTLVIITNTTQRDNGFKPAFYEKVWTTFLKARLNCSIPGEFPFYFDEIRKCCL